MASVLACMLFAAVSGSLAGDRGGDRLDRHRRHGQGRLLAELRRRRDLQRRHARHPDPAVDRHGGLRARRPKPRSAGCSSPASFPGILLGLMLMVAIYVAARGCSTCRASRGALGARRPGRRPRGDLGAAADRHHPGRHLRRRVHADRGRRRRRGLCLPDRRLRLPRHRPEGRAARPGRLRPGHGDADVHHRQRPAVRACADDRAHPAGDRRDHRRLGHAAVAVPAGRQHPAADRRQFHGAVRRSS